MKAPQIILLTLYGVSLLINANQHGKPQKPSNFWTTAIGFVLVFALLIWGGFFR